jgi:hypothetical protein
LKFNYFVQKKASGEDTEKTGLLHAFFHCILGHLICHRATNHKNYRIFAFCGIGGQDKILHDAMTIPFSAQDIEAIARVLDISPTKQDSAWMWQMVNGSTGQAQTVMVHESVDFGNDEVGSLIAVQTGHGYFELHGCNHVMLFEPDEVIFLRVDDLHVSSMVIGKNCTCSMFAPIKRELLRTDPILLDPAVLMSAMQMSIAESILS